MSSTTPATTGYLSTNDALTNYGGTSGTSGTPSPLTMTGLSSGIDVNALINALMGQAAAPQKALQAQLTSTNNTLTDYQALNADAQQLQTAADAVSTPSSWQVFSASSSSSAVTATAGTGAVAGTLSFTVDQLATAASLVSSGSVPALTAEITSPASSLLVATGGAGVGLGSITGSLAAGSHTITVTQASAAASVTGTALAASSTIGAGDQLTVAIDGQTSTLTLAGGTGLTPAQVAAQVNQAAAAAGAPLGATVDAQGRLVLSATTGQGSAHSIQVTQGSALGELGLTAQATATTGTDAVVSVDGTATTLTDVHQGAALTLNGPGGSTVTATATGAGLLAGTVNAASVSTGDGSLAAVASAINGSGLGVTASSVQTGPSAYRLQLTSKTTGSAASIDLPPGSLGGIGALETLTAGADARVTVGSGPAAFDVTSPTNAVSALMPGVTVNLQATTAGQPVTVTVSPNAAAVAGKVSTLVAAANAIIKDINAGQAPPTTGGTTVGPLLGDSLVDSLLAAVQTAVSGATGGGAGSAAGVGITFNQDGTLSFDQAAFTAAYTADPAGTQRMFVQGGSSQSPAVQVYEGSDATQAGTYAVQVTAAATQATATGAALGPTATLTGPETIAVSTGVGSFTYGATAGQTLAQVAAGLNSAATAAHAGIAASVVNGALQLQSVAYGTAANFTVTSTATGAGSTGIAGPTGTTTVTGTDVAGTINGVAATGSGQLLIGAIGSPEQGLLLKIGATPAQVAAGLTTSVTYSPGIAQRLATVAAGAADPVRGTLTYAISGTQSEVKDLNTQIANWNPILAQQQAMLVQQYTAMETALAVLKNTQTTLFGSTSGSGSSSSNG